MFHFKREKVNLDETNGVGNFGTVYPYQKDPSDKKWVVKNINTKNVDEVLAYFQEIVIGFSCHHPYVLPMKGYYIDYDKAKRDWDIYIKMPRIDRSLRTILNEHKQDKTLLSEKMIAQYFYDLTQGLEYLHGRGIAHRDIKPDNVLIGEDGAIQIADFGLGTYQGGESTRHALVERAGSGFYAAPENLDPDVELKKEDLCKADLWSLGMVMFELCTKMELRYLDFSNRKNIEDQLARKLQEFEGGYSKELISLITSLLKINAAQRKDLKSVQQELTARYGGFRGIEQYTQGVQTDMGAYDLIHFLNAQQKLGTKEELITQMEKEHKDAITNYEFILKDLMNALEAKDNEIREFKYQRDMKGYLKETDFLALKQGLQAKEQLITEMEEKHKNALVSYEFSLIDLSKKLEAKDNEIKVLIDQRDLRVYLNEKLKQELEVKEKLITQMNKEHKNVLANYELRLKELMNRFGVKELEGQRDMGVHVEEEKIDILQSQQSNKKIKTITQELKDKWKNHFEISDEPESGISIVEKKNYTHGLNIDVVPDLTQILDSNDCEPLEHFNLAIISNHKSYAKLMDSLVKACQCRSFQNLQTFSLKLSAFSVLKRDGYCGQTNFRQLVEAIGLNLQHLKHLKLMFIHWEINEQTRQWALDELKHIPEVFIEICGESTFLIRLTHQ